MASIVEESLEFHGIKLPKDAVDRVRRTRARSGLTEGEVLDVAQEGVKALRPQP